MTTEQRLSSRHKRKLDLISVLGGKCQICGFHDFPEALEFHHENPNEKDFNISDAVQNGANLENCLNEIKKCYLVCANCHRGIHNGYYTNPLIHIYDKEKAKEILINTQVYHGNIPTNSICPICGKKKSRGQTQLCSECARKATRKVDHPSRDELKNMIRTMSFAAIGKQYGVHGESVRGWCRRENLPDTKTDINSYSEQEWDLI